MCCIIKKICETRVKMLDPKTLIHKQSPGVEDICSSFVRGKISYASVGIIDDGIVYSAFSHKDWQDTYQNCSLLQYDPSFLGALRVGSVPIFWDTVPIMTKKAAGIMRQRCEYTGVQSGVTISFKDASRVLVLTLGAKLNSVEFLEYINNGVFESFNVRDILWKKLD